MAILKGQTEHKKWKKGERLTRKEAILAMCYDCNGFEEGGVDCDAGNGYDNCPLYDFMPYNLNRRKQERTEKQKEQDKKLFSKRMKQKSK